MKRFDGFHDVVAQEEAIEKEEYSASIAAMSLMYLYRLYGNQIYIPPAKVNMKGLPEIEWSIEPPFKVGICWKGNPGHPLDRFRSIPVKDFLVFGCDAVFPLVNLQYDAEDDPEFNGYAMTRGHVGTWEQTLASISHMDLIVTVDTAVAHLAGTIGKPTWILLAKWGDFRWSLTGDKTPWYPSAQLIRQEKLLEWGPAMLEVKARLEKLVGTS